MDFCALVFNASHFLWYLVFASVSSDHRGASEKTCANKGTYVSYFAQWSIQRVAAVIDGIWFRVYTLDISRTVSIPSAHKAGLTCLCLELVENRYLLATAADSSFAIYDTGHACANSKAPCCLDKIDRSKREGHKYAVSCAAWYPIDTGLFVTGSYDQDIKVYRSPRPLRHLWVYLYRSAELLC